MRKLLIPSVVALALFATSASADHIMYTAGNAYRDSGLITCSTQEASLKVILSITTVEYLTYGVARRISEANNCNFHGDPVNFTVGNVLCRESRADGRIFSVAIASVEGQMEPTFTMLFTNSKAPACGEHLM